MNFFDKLELSWSQGYDGNNLAFIDRKTAVTTCGCMMKIIDTTTGKEQTFKSNIHPFGTFTVNPNSSLIAYANKKLKPNIEIMNYPDLDHVQTLEGGCLMEYVDLAFYPNNDLLLSLSGIPDFLVTLWNHTTGEKLYSMSTSSFPGNRLSFNPLSWRQFSITGDQSFQIGNIELIDGKYSLKVNSIELPKPDVPLGEVEKSTDFLRKKFLPAPILASENLRVASTLNPLFYKYKDKLKRVAPVSHSWSHNDCVYVGCSQGQLLHYNTKTNQLTVLTNPNLSRDSKHIAKEASGHSKIEEEDEDEKFKPIPAQLSLACGDLETIAFSQDGLYTCGSTMKLKLVTLDTAKPDVIDCWETKNTVSTLAWSTVYDKILLGSPDGVIYSFFPSNKNADLNILHNGKFGEFIGADFISPSNTHIISARSKGVVQIWESETSEQLSNIHLNAKLTAIASSPSSRCVFIGTSDGYLYVVSVSKPEDPCIVFEDKLHEGPVLNILFEPSGRLVVTGSNDGNVVISDTRASEKFKCVATIDIAGEVNSMCAFHQLKIEKEVCYIFISSVDKGQSVISRCRVPVDLTSQPKEAYDNDCYHLAPSFIERIDVRLKYCCSGLACTSKSTLVTIDSFRKQIVNLEITDDGHVKETQRIKGHLLKGGSVKVSSHRKWIATYSGDGQVIYRTDHTKGEGLSVPCHSHFKGGITSVVFSSDGQQLITTGKDGVLAFWKWNYDELSDEEKVNVLGAVDSHRGRYASLLGLRKEQDAILKNMSAIVPDRSADAPTWLQTVQMDVQEIKDRSYDAVISDLKKKINELRATVLGMIETNEKVDDIEKLKRHEFTLDIDERQRLLERGQDEIDKIKKSVEEENLAMLFLRDLIKKECWDNMEVKGKALCLFNGELEVSNFPIKMQTEEEISEVERVLAIHAFEQVEAHDINYVEGQARKDTDTESSTEEKTCAPLFGSHALRFCPESQQSDQFQLHSNKRKRDQIILVQNTIRKLKLAFNKEFDDVYFAKKQEISRVSERLDRIRQILKDLKSPEETVVPSFRDIEQPECFLVVEDDEIKVQKYLTPEQEAARLEAERLEAERRRLADADNARERALIDMMHGKLEIRPEDELAKDLVKPDFMLQKSEDQWNEEEIKAAKEFEKKEKHLKEEREKYRKALEAELKKLQTANAEGMANFDEKLQKLFRQRIEYQKTVNQEELKIVRLARLIYGSACNEQEDERLRTALENFKTYKILTQDEIIEIKKIIDRIRDEHDIMLLDDKAMEKQFRKGFSDLDPFTLDVLAKLYKRRPKLTKQKSMHSDLQSRKPFGNRQEDADKIYLEAMAELDSEVHKPEILSSDVWERFIVARGEKVDNELQIKQHGQQLNDISNYLQSKTDEDEMLKTNIEDTFQKLNDLRDSRLNSAMNLEVQLLLKQGQVEIDAGIFATDYHNALLLHRSVIEDLNSHIVTLGEAKIAAMIDCKDYYKNIHLLEWEHEQMQMQGEDLITRTREVQTLRVTKELQMFLFEENTQQRMQKEVQTLEKTIKINESMFQRKVKDKKRSLARLDRMISEKESDCNELDSSLKELAVSLVERQQIQDASGGADMIAVSEQRMRDIVARRKLVELAKSQSQEVAVLRAEVERLRMKTFPALVQNVP